MRLEDLGLIVIKDDVGVYHRYSEPNRDTVQIIATNFNLDEDELLATIENTKPHSHTLLVKAPIFRKATESPKPIDWDQIHKDWAEHWLLHPPSYDLLESFNDFWSARGGRELYFEHDDQGKEVPRTHYRKD